MPNETPARPAGADPAAAPADTLVIGAGLAGLVTALHLLDAGQRVTVLDRGPIDAMGGQAREAFGGMCLVDTPDQRRLGIRDSAALALADWLGFARFGPEDHWPRRWAEHYVERCRPEVYEWLRQLGLGFIPAVQWVERGLYAPGNSVPRYHVLWGGSLAMVQAVLARLHSHPRRAALRLLGGCRVQALLCDERGAVRGCRGVAEPGGTPFEQHAAQVVVAAGGASGDLARVRANWPRHLGDAPATLLAGAPPQADGALHDAVAALGGRVTHLDWMWNYPAGVAHPQPRHPEHGLSLIPARSALWLDPQGRRIGPEPLVSGFDTQAIVERIARAGWPHTWQLMNRRIAQRELAASGADYNPLIRDRRRLAFAWQMLRGNRALVDHLLARCPDVVQAATLGELAQRMDAVPGASASHGPGASGGAGAPLHVDPQALIAAVRAYDAQIERGPRFHNDEQLRRLAQLRRWPGERLRTCRTHRLSDPDAGPWIAIRCRILIRKSMGGIQTDLHSRVLGADGQPLPGLYAVGEASGFGGGGSNGAGSLEGTFLSGCILTARAAARHIGGHR